MKFFGTMLAASFCLLLSVTAAHAALPSKGALCVPKFGKICLGEPCFYLIPKIYTDGDFKTKIVCDAETKGTTGTWVTYLSPPASSPPAPAATPTPPCSPQSTPSCVDQPCLASQLGVSVVQLDYKNIIICLLNDDGTDYEWKSMVDDYDGQTAWSSTTQFYEDTEGTWVGDTCPTGKIMTGMSTTNVGMGGHNYWSIDCK